MSNLVTLISDLSAKWGLSMSLKRLLEVNSVD